MGLDTQLVDDGTYYAVEADGEIAGCGGWSRRATLYGSDSTLAAEGFTRLQLAGTLSGEPLYKAYGFVEVGRKNDETGGAPVPIVLMERPIRL